MYVNRVNGEKYSILKGFELNGMEVKPYQCLCFKGSLKSLKLDLFC